MPCGPADRIPGIDAVYQRYFGQLPAVSRPQVVPLRGPLLFGLAESERARHFLGCLEQGAWAQAAALMCAGHDGDWVRLADGSPCLHDVGDAALSRWSAQQQPLVLCPGAYGASSPILDALVDTALHAGALGRLTDGCGTRGQHPGAVRTGCWSGLCDSALEALLCSPRYEALTGHAAPAPETVGAHAVLENCATQGAGEIMLPGL